MTETAPEPTPMTGLASLMHGMPIVVSDQLPYPPSPGEWARRYVRHQYASAGVLEWLGQEPGPEPDDETHVLLIDGTWHVSRTMLERITARVDTSPTNDMTRHPRMT